MNDIRAGQSQGEHEPPDRHSQHEASDEPQQSGIRETPPLQPDDDTAGEMPDVVRDDLQETGEDNTANSEDQAFARQSPAPAPGEEAERGPTRQQHSRSPLMPVPHQDKDRYESEESGEAGDVVQDATQETGEDRGAQAAEERAHDQDAPRRPS